MTTMETYYGHIRTQLDAILLFEACRIGYLPRINRRLSERERLRIRSGSIFIWDEREASMRRWTDGKSWSASRVSGSFLIYKEMDPNHHNHSSFRRPSNETDGEDSGSSGGRKRKHGTDDGYANSSGEDEESSNSNIPYKPEGLIKQSFSITTSTDRKLHLIAYYHPSDVNSNYLIQPSLDPKLKDIQIPLDMYPDTSFSGTRLIPAVTLVSLDANPYHHHPYYRNPHNPFQSQGGPTAQHDNHNIAGHLPMGVAHPLPGAEQLVRLPTNYSPIQMPPNPDHVQSAHFTANPPAAEYYPNQRPPYSYSTGPPHINHNTGYSEYIPSSALNGANTTKSLSVSTASSSNSSSTVTSTTSTSTEYSQTAQEHDVKPPQNTSLTSLSSVKQLISLPSPSSQTSISSILSSPSERERERERERGRENEIKRPRLLNEITRVESPLPSRIIPSASTVSPVGFASATPPPPLGTAIPSQSPLRMTQSATSLPMLSRHVSSSDIEMSCRAFPEDKRAIDLLNRTFI